MALARALGAQPPGASDVRELPLVEVPAAASGDAPAAVPARRSLAILLTGDGDWAAIDRGIAQALAGGGVSVVGLRIRAYLARGLHGRRTPDDLARDVARIARAYLARWGRDRLVLLGYSRGADFLPFVATRLAPDVGDRVALVVLYAADRDASFEFHVLDLLIDRHRASDLPVGPELARFAARPGAHVLCVYGTEEHDSPCRPAAADAAPAGAAVDVPGGADGPALRRVERAGAHHLDRDYPALGRLALEALARP